MKFNFPDKGVTLTGCHKHVKFWVWMHQRSLPGEDQVFEIRAADMLEIAEKGEPKLFDPNSAGFSQLPSITNWSSVEKILDEAIKVLDSGADFWQWFDSLEIEKYEPGI